MRTTTRNPRSTKSRTGLIALFVIVILSALACVSYANASGLTASSTAVEPANELDPLDGIEFAGDITGDDVAYLRDNLQFLHDQLPQWWEYVEQAKPFTFSIDQTLAAQGRAAASICCDERGYGLTTFGHHFGQLTVSTDPFSQTVEARRIAFLGMLVHELTHVRDLRTERFAARGDYGTCVEAERSGLTKQIELWRDMAFIKLGLDPASSEIYALRLDQQINIEGAALRSRELWYFYCGDLLVDA